MTDSIEPAVAALEAVLAPGTRLRELEPDLFSVLEPEDEVAHYDDKATAYDRLAASRIYSRLAWGIVPERFTRYIEDALASRSTGWVADVAAGSCVASAEAYVGCSRPILVLDRSIVMLRLGIARLRRIAGHVPENVVFLQGDANALPLRTDSMSTVLCHGAFHVFEAPEPVCTEWVRVLAPGGSLFVTSLVRGRAFGDAYLRLLHRAGEVAPPRSAAEFAAAIHPFWSGEPRLESQGNFAFLTYERAEPRSS
jgi:ubiquinone/menaquinone biosynthesis C-methylase UbiE